MINSDIKGALRTFYQEKSYAFINLSGLSLAIACCLILGLYLKFELTYDRHNLRHKEIFRVVNNFNTNNASKDFVHTSPALGPMLKDNFPEVIDYVRFRPTRDKLLIKVDEKAFFWENVYHADVNVFDVFTHDIIYGDPETALEDPQSAAVSETFAGKYFGDTNPIGKTIHVDEAPEIPRKVTLVFRDQPANSHLKYDVLLHESPNLGQGDPKNQLFGIWYYTYLIMPEDYDINKFRAISEEFFDRFMSDTGKALNTTWRSWIQPLADIHLQADIPSDPADIGNRYYIYGFSAVAVFILLVACINYINLAIARATKRAREIAMRKILGAPRFLLILRFLGEAVIFAFIAMVFSVVIVKVITAFTSVDSLFGKPLELDLIGDPVLKLWILGLTLFVGILSGLYPAVYLSSISPMSALSEARGGNTGGFRLRGLLVLIQFTVSVLVIAGTLVMSLQMMYIANKPLGFNKENRLIVYLRGLNVVEKHQVIKKELLKDSHILGITTSGGIVGTGQGFPINLARVDNNEGVLEETGFTHTPVGNDYFEVMGIPLSSGRDFSQRFLTDVGTSFVVNETFAEKMGWNEPLGKRINLGQNSGRVIGVAKDFHFRSLHQSVESFAMYQFNDNFENIPPDARPGIQRNMILHISDQDMPKTLSFLQDRFAEYDPRHPFDYDFLDDLINEQYLSEDRLMKMTGIFSGICIFISCLGLYGLTAFTTEQRKKEIGIRKVLGASATQIILMLARNILWLVLVGSVVASIIAFFALDEWLTGFAYQASMVGVPLLIFPLSAAAVIAVAFATIALQSYRIARSNPAVTIRYE
jgi:putative ABC transport system permease protein